MGDFGDGIGGESEERRGPLEGPGVGGRGGLQTRDLRFSGTAARDGRGDGEASLGAVGFRAGIVIVNFCAELEDLTTASGRGGGTGTGEGAFERLNVGESP